MSEWDIKIRLCMCHKYRFKKRVALLRAQGLGKSGKEGTWRKTRILRSRNRRMSTYNFIPLAMCSKLDLINKNSSYPDIIMCSISITFSICKLYATVFEFVIYYKDFWFTYKQLSGSLFIRIGNWTNNIWSRAALSQWLLLVSWGSLISSHKKSQFVIRKRNVHIWQCSHWHDWQQTRQALQHTRNNLIMVLVG